MFRNRIITFFFAVMVWSLFSSSFLVAEENPVWNAKNCDGSIYLAKKGDVPVYSEPALTAEVVARLSDGKDLCGVGLQSDFVVVIWPNQPGEREKGSGSLRFVRRVDLWKADSDRYRPESAWSVLKRYYYYLRSGGVPDDALFPYRPLGEIFKETLFGKEKENK